MRKIYALLKHSKYVLAFLLLTVIIINACKKDRQNLPLTKQDLIAEARSYFEDEVVNLPQLNDNNQRHKLNKTPLWNNASTIKISLGDAVIVPIKYDKDIYLKQDGELKNLDKLSYLMIYKDPDQKLNAEWVTLIPSDTEKKAGKFSGTLEIEHWNGKSKRAFAFGTDGTILPVYLSESNIFKKINYNRSITCYTTTWYGQTCVEGYGCGNIYIISSETYCYGSGGVGNNQDQETDDSENGSNGGGGGGPDPNNYIPDCNGDMGGTAYTNTECNTCMGGNTGITECPAYVCDCDCPEEDSEMVDANTNYEPKWGQLGNLNSIKGEVNKKINQTSNFNGLTLADKLLTLKGHFDANRNYTRDINGELIDAPGSKLVDRYIYTETNGWIDMHHFFYAAFLSEANSAAYAFTITTGAEYIQSQLEAQQNSAYSYEDLPSNYAGIKFWQQYGQNLKNGTASFDNALTSYFNSVKAKEPSEAPNYYYIPHIIDNLTPKNRTSKGLVGDILKNAAKESFCKKTTQVQNNIKEAHKKLKPSSH